MNVGDLVKFKDHLRGLCGLIGIIVAENGDGFDILWNNSSAHVGSNFMHGQTATELAEFLEKVNESQ